MGSHDMRSIIHSSIVFVQEFAQFPALSDPQSSHVVELKNDMLTILAFTFQQVDDLLEILHIHFEVLFLQP